MKKTASKSTKAAEDKLRRKELAAIKRERKSTASAVLRDLTTLRKHADRLVAAHRQHDARLARRAAILETRIY